MEKSGKNEYILTQDDVEDYSPMKLKKHLEILVMKETNIIPTTKISKTDLKSPFYFHKQFDKHTADTYTFINL
jgi:hypothetical protein